MRSLTRPATFVAALVAVPLRTAARTGEAPAPPADPPLACADSRADGGLTWSRRLPTPKSGATSKEVPTLHGVIGPDGTKRIIMWSGLYPARLAVTEDDGAKWSELKPVGDWGGIVVMGFVEELKTGKGQIGRAHV